MMTTNKVIQPYLIDQAKSRELLENLGMISRQIRKAFAIPNPSGVSPDPSSGPRTPPQGGSGVPKGRLNFIIDPTVPKDEIHARVNGKMVGQIVNIKLE